MMSGDATVSCKYRLPRLAAFTTKSSSSSSSSYTSYDVVQSVVFLIAHAYHTNSAMMHSEVADMFAGSDANVLCVIESTLWYLQSASLRRNYPYYRSKEMNFWQDRGAAMSPDLRDVLFEYYKGEFNEEFRKYHEFIKSSRSQDDDYAENRYGSAWGDDWGYRRTCGDCPVALVHRSFLLHYPSNTVFDSAEMCYPHSVNDDSSGLRGDSLGSEDTNHDKEVVLRGYKQLFQSRAHIVAYHRNWTNYTHVQAPHPPPPSLPPSPYYPSSHSNNYAAALLLAPGLVGYIVSLRKEDATVAFEMAELHLKRRCLYRLLNMEMCAAFDPPGPGSGDSFNCNSSQGGVFYFESGKNIFCRANSATSSSSSGGAGVGHDSQDSSPLNQPIPNLNLIFSMCQLSAVPIGDNSGAARKRKSDVLGLRILNPYELVGRALMLTAHAYRELYKMEAAGESQGDTYERRRECLVTCINIYRVICSQSSVYSKTGEGSIGEVARPAFSSYVGESAVHLARTLKKYYELTKIDGSGILSDLLEKLNQFNKIGEEYRIELQDLQSRHQKDMGRARGGGAGDAESGRDASLHDTPSKRPRCGAGVASSHREVPVRQLSIKPMDRELVSSLSGGRPLVGRVLYSLADLAPLHPLETTYGGFDVLHLSASQAAEAGVAALASAEACVPMLRLSIVDVEELGIAHLLSYIACIYSSSADEAVFCRVSIITPRAKNKTSWSDRILEGRLSAFNGTYGLRRGIVSGEVLVLDGGEAVLAGKERYSPSLSSVDAPASKMRVAGADYELGRTRARWVACHSENRIFHYLVGIFFADIMGDKGAEYMLTRPFETQPIDFCGSGAHGDGLCDGLPLPYLQCNFYTRRFSAVSKRLAAIGAMDADELRTFMTIKSNSPLVDTYNISDISALTRTGSRQVEFSLKECTSLAIALRGDRLGAVLHRVIREPESYLFHGLPDLICWNTEVGAPSSCTGSTISSSTSSSRSSGISADPLKDVVLFDNVFFAEVKSSNDTLKPHQRACLNVLAECGLRAEVLQVE